MSSPPKISIIVAVYNAERTLSACLDSLMALDFPKDEREIIVVDNHSTDRSKDIISKYPVVYLFEPNRGRAWARNKGIQHARGEYIAFTDSDCIVTKDWLTNLLEGFKGNDNIAVCGGKILAYRQDTLCERYVEGRGLLNQEVAVKGLNPGDLPRVVTANAAFRKTVFEEVGCFDEDLATSEDTELCWRMILWKGWEITYASEAVVYHQHTRALKQFLKHHFEYGRADAALDRKYGKVYFKSGKPPSAFVIFIFSLRVFFATVYSFLKGIFEGAAHHQAYFLFLDAVKHASYNLGYLYASLTMSRTKKKADIKSKVPLDRFVKPFEVRHNGTTWLLGQTTTWFICDGLMRLAVFSKGLNVYQFNKTATRIWLSLLETKDFKKMVNDVSLFYNTAAERIKEDADAFMATLEDEGILKKVSANQTN